MNWDKSQNCEPRTWTCSFECVQSELWANSCEAWICTTRRRTTRERGKVLLLPKAEPQQCCWFLAWKGLFILFKWSISPETLRMPLCMPPEYQVLTQLSLKMSLLVWLHTLQIALLENGFRMPSVCLLTDLFCSTCLRTRVIKGCPAPPVLVWSEFKRQPATVGRAGPGWVGHWQGDFLVDATGESSRLKVMCKITASSFLSTPTTTKPPPPHPTALPVQYVFQVQEKKDCSCKLKTRHGFVDVFNISPLCVTDIKQCQMKKGSSRFNWSPSLAAQQTHWEQCKGELLLIWGFCW